MLPLFRTWSPLFGSKLVSAVFNSYASPMYESPDDCSSHLQSAVAAGASHRVNLLEVKRLFSLPASAVAEHGLIARPRFRTTIVDLIANRPDRSGYTGKFRRHLRGAYERVRRTGVRI